MSLRNSNYVSFVTCGARRQGDGGAVSSQTTAPKTYATAKRQNPRPLGSPLRREHGARGRGGETWGARRQRDGGAGSSQTTVSEKYANAKRQNPRPLVSATRPLGSPCLPLLHSRTDTDAAWAVKSSFSAKRMMSFPALRKASEV